MVGCANSIDINLDNFNLPNWLRIEKNKPQYTLEVADVAIIASGTSTLEATLFGTPGVIVYKMSTISWLISKTIVKVERAGMGNLIANREVM